MVGVFYIIHVHIASRAGNFTQHFYPSSLKCCVFLQNTDMPKTIFDTLHMSMVNLYFLLAVVHSLLI